MAKWISKFLFFKGYSLLIKKDTLYFKNAYFCKVLLLKFVVTVMLLEV